MEEKATCHMRSVCPGNVYLELASDFLFLQEQIKDIIIISSSI
jgi:hypothetical protein